MSPQTEPSEPARGAASQLGQETFSLRAAIGGPRGVAESALPTLLFVVVYVVARDLVLAGGAAVAVVIVALVVRLVRRESPSTVIGGLIAAIIGALWAVRSGEGTDFYAPGLITNAVALAVVLLTLALRQPIVGVVIALLDPRATRWRDDPRMRRAYTAATWLFAGLYASKLAVQLPLYLAGLVSALGVAKLLMGLPLFALVSYIVWLMHRAAVRSAAPSTRSGGPDQAPRSAPSSTS